MAALVDSSSAMFVANTDENRMSEYTDINFARGLWRLQLKIKIEKTLLFEIVKKYRKYFEDIEEDLAAQLICEK